MYTITKIHCPNCGSCAQRKTLTTENITETSCQICDYFLVCSRDLGIVVEAYAPGISCHS